MGVGPTVGRVSPFAVGSGVGVPAGAVVAFGVGAGVRGALVGLLVDEGETSG